MLSAVAEAGSETAGAAITLVAAFRLVEGRYDGEFRKFYGDDEKLGHLFERTDLYGVVREVVENGRDFATETGVDNPR